MSLKGQPASIGLGVNLQFGGGRAEQGQVIQSIVEKELLDACHIQREPGQPQQRGILSTTVLSWEAAT